MKLIDLIKANEEFFANEGTVINGTYYTWKDFIDIYNHLDQDLVIHHENEIPDFGNLRFKFDNVDDGYRFIRSLEKRMTKFGKIPVQDYCLSGDCFAGNIYHNPPHKSLNYGWCMWPFLKVEEESNCLYVMPTAPYEI